MKNFFYKASAVLGATALAIAPMFASASTWTIASSTDMLSNTVYNQVGNLIDLVLSNTIPVVLGLLALGFGMRYLKRYITGKKF